MLKALVAAFAIFFISVVQTTLGSRLSLGSGSPNLPLLLTVSLGLVAGPFPGMLCGFSSALVQSGVTQAPLFGFAAALIPAGFAAGEFSRRLFHSHWLA